MLMPRLLPEWLEVIKFYTIFAELRAVVPLLRRRLPSTQ
jgi:hypothetical protein